MQMTQICVTGLQCVNIYGLDVLYHPRKKLYWLFGLQVVSILPEPTMWSRDIPQVDEETRQQLLNLRNHMDRVINQT
jgi:hypothetical protein